MYLQRHVNYKENTLHNMRVSSNYVWEKPMWKFKQGNSILSNCDLIITDDTEPQMVRM